MKAVVRCLRKNVVEALPVRRYYVSLNLNQWHRALTSDPTDTRRTLCVIPRVFFILLIASKDELPGRGFAHGDGCPASPGMGMFISTSSS